MQFCIHLYSILICGKYAQLVYWKHNYVVVTKHFDYQNSKNSLTEFIWQYSQLDSTITKQDKSDPYNQQLQTEKEEMKEQDDLHLQFHQMAINDHDDLIIKNNLLFSYPQNFALYLLFKKITQDIIDCDVDLEGCRNQIVYIKDYWRLEGGKKEGEIYQTLEEKNIPNISRFYYSNFSPQQNQCYSNLKIKPAIIHKKSSQCFHFLDKSTYITCYI